MTMKSACLVLVGLAAMSCARQAAEHAPAQDAAGAGDYRASGLMAAPIPEIAGALASGETTSEQLAAVYIARIKAVDWSGPELQSVLFINPNALEDARASDARRAAGETRGPLDGVPILLKDNIESADPMPTTAGALALKENLTGRDSPLVAGLRAQGAVILGKTNLSQWANFRSNSSMSGWSALGGQVKNPHIIDRNPCGSSSGSGAAVAAALAAGAVGTETNGSISCPSTVNGIVGFKPTVGLVSQQYIVPISSTQDTAGPMTRTVTGAAMLLSAMATGQAKADYAAALDANSLAGKRIGVARFAQGGNAAVVALFDAALSDLEAAGAELVEIAEFTPSDPTFGEDEGKILRYEFKAAVNGYLANAAPAVTTRDLDALIAFNKAHADVELALFDQGIFEESAKLGGLDAPDYREALARALKASREDGVDKLLADNNVVAIVSPSGPLAPAIDAINGDVWPEFPGAGDLAAIAGYPHLTVPMGAVKGAPAGLSFIGAKDDDAAILSYGYAYEQQSKKRMEPRYLRTASDDPAIGAAMKRMADD